MKIPEILITRSLSLPIIGLGTWLLRGQQCTRAVEMALDIGYRHFDTAHVYENHEAIRKGLRGVLRENLAITSKFTIPQLSKMSVEETCDLALKELDVDYLDLYLLHYPIRSANMKQIVDEMERLVEKQKVKAIGVSNCTERHLRDLHQANCHFHVNQVEFHPYLYQKKLLNYCLKHNVHLMSYRSLGKGALIADPILEKIGEKYHKTPAQISLRWLIEKKISVIPKASTKKHLEENFDLFDFSLDKEDVDILDNLEHQHRFCEREWSDFNYV